MALNASGGRADRRGRWVVYGAEALLLVAAVIWGVAFVAQKRASGAGVEVMPLTAMRFLMGAALLSPLALLRRRRVGADFGRKPRHLWLGGIAAGCAMFAGSTLQQAGLHWTDSGVAGFITGLYVIFVPLIGLAFGMRPGWPVWVGASLAVVGMYLLSVHDRPTISPGDLLILASAGCWAIHVLVVGWAAPRTDPIVLSVVQFAVTGLLGAVGAMLGGAMPFEGFELAARDVIYLGVFAVAIAFTLQVIGQSVAPPGHAAIILSLEAVAAAIAGAFLRDETLGRAALAGSALMFAGIIVSQVIRPPKPLEPDDPANAGPDDALTAPRGG